MPVIHIIQARLKVEEPAGGTIGVVHGLHHLHRRVLETIDGADGAMKIGTKDRLTVLDHDVSVQYRFYYHHKYILF